MNPPSPAEKAEPETPGPAAAPPVEGDGRPAPAEADEVDVWWGGYATRAMWPSFLACLVATLVCGWLDWLFVPAGYVKLAFLGLAGAVWLFQGGRWAYRAFAFTYRLTTRRLFCHYGFLYTPADQIDLTGVARIRVRRSGFDRLAGVGHVLVYADDPGRPPLVLRGVRGPARVAEMIRVQAQRAKEQGSVISNQ